MGWHHAPPHRFTDPGPYIITGGTYLKEHFFAGRERLDRLRDIVKSEIRNAGSDLESWSIFSNHYHMIVNADQPQHLPEALKATHEAAAQFVNELDGLHGRQVWFQYWDTYLSYQKSYLARLKYVHQNPVHHGLVRNAVDYPWCSAAEFERTADRSFYCTVMSFKIDRVNVIDSWDPLKCGTQRSGVSLSIDDRD